MPEKALDDRLEHTLADQSPADRLKALRDQLRSQDDEVASKTKARDTLQAEVESLAKTVDEIDKAGMAYSKSLDGLKDDREKIDAYQKGKTLALDSVLGEEKTKKIKEKIEEVKQNITKESDELKKADQYAQNAAGESQLAEKILAEKQKDYDRYKNIQQDLTAKVQKLKNLKTKIEELDDQTKPASMYVYLQELKWVLEGTTVPTLEEFKAGLNTKSKELDAAKEDTRKKKLASQAATEKLTKGQTELAAVEKSRVDDILQKVEAYNS